MLLLYSFVIRWKKNTARKIGDPLLIKQLIRDYSPSKFSFKFVLFIAAFAVAVIALANPRLPQGSTTINRSGIDVMIALDVSKSMLAQDIKPNRLERAKQVLAKLIDRLQDDRIGIVVFAGRAYLQMPLTTDHGAAKMYLSSVSPDAVPTQGTVIGDALKMSFAAFNSKEKKYRSIVLISDGEDHETHRLRDQELVRSDSRQWHLESPYCSTGYSPDTPGATTTNVRDDRSQMNHSPVPGRHTARSACRSPM